MSTTNSESSFSGEQAFINFTQYYRSLPESQRAPLFSSGLLGVWLLKAGQKKPGIFDKAEGMGTFMVWQDYIVLLAWRTPNVPEKSTGDKAKQFGKELAFQVASEALADVSLGLSTIITDRLESSIKGDDPNTIALKQKNMDPWELLGSPRSHYFPKNAIVKLEEQKYMTLQGFRLEASTGQTFLIAPMVGEGASTKAAIDLKSAIERTPG